MVSDDLKLGTRARQKIARRAAILAAAECALGSDGDVAVEEIASAAGLAKGTVYNYFPDKAALVEAVTQSVERRLLADIVASPVSAPLARLALLLCGLLERAGEDCSAAAIACRRMAEGSGEGGAIGRAVAAELKMCGYASAMESDEESAALTLILGAMRAAMLQTCFAPHPRRRARDAVIAVMCLRALGAEADAAEATVETAMDALDASRRAAASNWRPPARAH